MSDVRQDSTVRQAPDVITREVDGEVVAFQPRSGLAHMLNTSATAIWCSVEQPTSVSTISETLADIVGGERDLIARDVLATVQHLLDSQLLELVP